MTIILKCTKCGIEETGSNVLEVAKKLSEQGCIFTFGNGIESWCVCGEKNSFKKENIIEADVCCRICGKTVSECDRG